MGKSGKKSAASAPAPRLAKRKAEDQIEKVTAENSNHKESSDSEDQLSDGTDHEIQKTVNPKVQKTVSIDQAAKKQLPPKKAESSRPEDEAGDGSHHEIQKTSNPKVQKTVSLEQAAKKAESSSPESFAPMQTLSCNQPLESRTLYVGNIPYGADIENVKHHFADVANPVAVRVPTDNIGQSMGYAYLQFATLDDADRGLGLNGSDFWGRKITVDVASERGNASRVDARFSGMPSESPNSSLYVTGFDASLPRDKIVNSLEKFFTKCGEVSRVFVPVDKLSGQVKGMAFVDLKDERSFNLALSRNGSGHEGKNLRIKVANRSSDRSGGSRSGVDGGKNIKFDND